MTKTKTSNLSRLYPDVLRRKWLLFPLLTIVVIACLLLVFESDFLWKTQEQNLFLDTCLFFKEEMVVPGGLLSWAGTFFTQLFYYPWLGVLVLAAWWTLLAWLTGRAFQQKNVLAVVPVLLVLVTIVDIGYWLYVLKLHGHFFTATIATTAVTALLWAYRVVCRRPETPAQSATPLARRLLPHLLILITCIVGYPLMGAYALGAALVMAVWSWRLLPRRAGALALTLTAVACVIVIPLLFYRYVYYETNIANIYYAAIPLYYIQEEYLSYYVPFYLLLAFYAFMALLPSPTQQRNDSITPILLRLALFLAAIVFTGYNWYRDENFHHELAMQRSLEHLDWDGVLREAATQQDEPTRAIVMMRNVALARLGRQGNEMYRYPNGSKQINAPFPMRMLLVNGPLVYYHYGMPNCCHRLATEMGVEFGWRAENIKFLARSAILNGEWQLARKFISMLRHTMFFGSWADQMSRLIEHPDDIAKSPEMGFITHMMHYNNRLTADGGFVEDFIMKRLAASTYADDPVFTEQALLASMWTRNEQAFWRHLLNYARLHPNSPLPLHIQEAAMLFGTIEERPGMESAPLDNSVKDSYNRFNQMAPQYNDADINDVRKALYPLFGKTYYYEYYLMSDLPQY